MSSSIASTTFRKLLLKTALIISLFAYFPSVSMAKPTESLLSSLENCQFVGKVEGSSGYGRKMERYRQAKSSALSRAETLGGNHVVWERMIPVGVYNGYAIARVYSCG